MTMNSTNQELRQFEDKFIEYEFYKTHVAPIEDAEFRLFFMKFITIYDALIHDRIPLVEWQVMTKLDSVVSYFNYQIILDPSANSVIGYGIGIRGTRIRMNGDNAPTIEQYLATREQYDEN